MITYVMIVTIMIILKWVTHDACAAITKKRYLFRKIQLYLFELRIWSFFVRKNLLWTLCLNFTYLKFFKERPSQTRLKETKQLPLGVSKLGSQIPDFVRINCKSKSLYPDFQGKSLIWIPDPKFLGSTHFFLHSFAPFFPANFPKIDFSWRFLPCPRPGSVSWKPRLGTGW